jgi:hypothetical protein
MTRILLVLLLINWSLTSMSQMKPLKYGHAHNDYLHKRPLLDALELGFTSIEIDLYYIYKRAKVSHTPILLCLKPQLKPLYFDPLREMIRKNGGTVFPDHQTQLTLMIEFKHAPEKLYVFLKDILKEFEDILTIPFGKNKRTGPVRIILMRGPSIDMLLEEETPYFAIDGSASHLSSGIDPDLIPRISLNYNNYFTWRGEGNMPVHEKELLEEMVARAKEKKRQIRFWAMPENEDIWKTFIDAGVDVINVDDLERYARFERKSYYGLVD